MGWQLTSAHTESFEPIKATLLSATSRCGEPPSEPLPFAAPLLISDVDEKFLFCGVYHGLLLCNKIDPSKKHWYFPVVIGANSTTEAKTIGILRGCKSDIDSGRKKSP